MIEGAPVAVEGAPANPADAGPAGADRHAAAHAQYERDMEAVVASRPVNTLGPSTLASGMSPVAPAVEHPVLLKRRGCVCFRDHQGRPLAGKHYLLVVDGRAITGTTDPRGWIGPVDPSASAIDVTVEHVVYHLMFTTPSAGVATAQSALNGLGYSAGPLDGQLGLRTRVAISSYQSMRGLTVNGEGDAATLEALRLEHVVTDWRSPP